MSDVMIDVAAKFFDLAKALREDIDSLRGAIDVLSERLDRLTFIPATDSHSNRGPKQCYRALPLPKPESLDKWPSSAVKVYEYLSKSERKTYPWISLGMSMPTYYDVHRLEHAGLAIKAA